MLICQIILNNCFFNKQKQMKIIRLNDAYKVITLVPRIFPNDGDTISIRLRDEITDVKSIINHNWNYQNNYFTIELLDPVVGVEFYQLYHKYEITIIRDDVVIFQGRLEVIGDESIQDFKHSIITVNKKIKI